MAGEIKALAQQTAEATNEAVELTTAITYISNATDEMNNGSRQNYISADDLSRLPENLNITVGRFQLS